MDLSAPFPFQREITVSGDGGRQPRGGHAWHSGQADTFGYKKTFISVPLTSHREAAEQYSWKNEIEFLAHISILSNIFRLPSSISLPVVASDGRRYNRILIVKKIRMIFKYATSVVS